MSKPPVFVPVHLARSLVLTASLLAGSVISSCTEGSADPISASTDGDSPATGSESGLPRANPLTPVIEPGDVLAEGEPPVPDVERPDYVASSGFFVQGGRVYDTFGKSFVFRGVNNAHIWFDPANRYLALEALDEIATFGFNSVRIVWETDAMNPGASSALLDSIIARVLSLRMVPMIELHDVTGDETNERLLDMAEYYAREDIREILIKWEPFLVVNIANEWSGDDFVGGYRAAIQHLRDNGINHMLVIDANGFGQNATSVLTNGQGLLDFDPQHNLLFSVHMYGNYTGNMGPNRIINTLNQASTLQLPLIIGEFGWQAGNQNLRPIDFRLIMSECVRHGFGYFPWSWKGNSGNVVYLDMAIDWSGGTLSDWGNDVINDPNGIAATSAPASFFAVE